MTFLLDTNILCELRRPRPNRGLARWSAGTPGDQMHLSVLTIGEIRNGINVLRGRGDHAQAAAFESWLADLVAKLGDRIVPVTEEVTRMWALRRPVSVINGLLAATATAHGWTLVTRNIKDFEHTGVRVLNPFTE